MTKYINSEYHTNQACVYKEFRIVIRNLHPTTSTTEIRSDIENMSAKLQLS